MNYVENKIDRVIAKKISFLWKIVTEIQQEIHYNHQYKKGNAVNFVKTKKE